MKNFLKLAGALAMVGGLIFNSDGMNSIQQENGRSISERNAVTSADWWETGGVWHSTQNSRNQVSGATIIGIINQMMKILKKLEGRGIRKYYIESE